VYVNREVGGIPRSVVRIVEVAMNRVGWLVAFLVFGSGMAAFGDCGCAPAGNPSCYSTFSPGWTVEFTLKVPVDYFAAHATTETPFVTGWRVETLDGALVHRVTFGFPLGTVTRFEWRLTDDVGGRVAAGFYRIVVETTSAGDIASTVLVASCCNPCGCTGRIPACRPACGEAYLILRPGEYLGCCCGCVFSFFGSSGTGAP
jgi:hypothetical protein